MSLAYIARNRYFKDHKEQDTYRYLTNMTFTSDRTNWERLYTYLSKQEIVPAGRILSNCLKPRPYKAMINCSSVRPQDNIESWGDTIKNVILGSKFGIGFGIDGSLIRAKGSKLKSGLGRCGGVMGLFHALNEAIRSIIQENDRHGALLAQLSYDHPDIHDFINAKIWSKDILEAKKKDIKTIASFDHMNLSVYIDNLRYLNTQSFRNMVDHAIKYGDPGFIFNFINTEQEYNLRNACAEACFRNPLNSCILGAVNLAKISSLDHLYHTVFCLTCLLIRVQEETDTPTKEFENAKNEDPQVGVGLMGLHEWLICRGYPWEPNLELTDWLETYVIATEDARDYMHKRGSSFFNKLRSCQPTGTTSLLGETSAGVDPIYSLAYERRYYDNGEYKRVVTNDVVIQKLYDKGVDVSKIETAHEIDFIKRLEMQTYLQIYIDQAISTTINLPEEVKVDDIIGAVRRFAPGLKGLTLYCDGTHGGQVFTPCTFDTGNKKESFVNICSLTDGGGCGD